MKAGHSGKHASNVALSYGNNDFPAWTTIIKDGDRNVIQIKNDDSAKIASLVKYLSKEEFAKVKGKKITCTVMVKADNIGGGTAKFMLMVGLPNKKSDWPDAQIGKGSFDWKAVKFVYDVPYAAESVAMVLGLERATGTIKYKDLKITVSDE